MSEIPAAQLRDIMINREQINAESWYQTFKSELFESFKNHALNGNIQIMLTPEDWEHNEAKKNYMKNRLIGLDYSVSEENKNLIVGWV